MNRLTAMPIDVADPGLRGQRAVAARVWSGVALAGICLTLVVFALLHLLPPTAQISPVHRTISEYALTGSAWAFDFGVIALAIASAAMFAGLVTLRRLRVMSVASLFGALWVAGLVTLVSFPKYNRALGEYGSSSGQIHRMASLVAFVALPVAVLVIARRRDRVPHPPAARWAFWLAIGSLAWFLPIVIAVLSAPRAWWQQIPLGLIERGLALTEVLAIVALALLVRAGSVRVGSARAGSVRASGTQNGGQLTDLRRTDSAATADQ